MKKILTFYILAAASVGTAFAQYAGGSDSVKMDEGYKGYNRLGLSYNNDSYRFNGDDDDSNFSLNGFGINYLHGFGLSHTYPMFLEVGANINFMFGNVYSEEEKEYDYLYKEQVKMQNINLQVPISYVWRFNVADNLSISPYAGLDFKFHLLRQMKYVAEERYDDEMEKEESDWVNVFDKDEIDEPGWKRFQMGWHIGVGFQYTRIHLGLQYGTDFLPAYSYKMGGETAKVNTGNLKLILSCSF